MIYIKKTFISFVLLMSYTTTASADFKDFLLDPFSVCKISTTKKEVNERLSFTYTIYENKKKPNQKAVVVLPPTGGKNILDKGYAAMFCKAGYKVYVFEGYTGVSEYTTDIDVHQRYQTNFQKSLASLIQSISEKDIGVLGASAGAINFSVTMGIPEVISRVKVFVGIATGGPLYKVIANAGEKALKKAREERMERFKLSSLNEYEQKINNNLSWNISQKKPDHLKLGLIVATDDTTVLTKFQESQVKAMQPDFLIRIESNHFGAIVRSFLFHRKQIKSFMAEVL
ncbi:MAG: hypothetical protein ACRBBP_03715 [Bdellovibrionales bacterium]